MLSQRLKDAREAAGLTQKKLAEKAGVSQQLITKIENGKTLQSRKIVQIAHALEMTAEELTGEPGHGAKVAAKTPEKSLVHGYSISEEAARLAAEWEKLLERDRARALQFQVDLETTVAEVFKADRRSKKKPDRSPKTDN